MSDKQLTTKNENKEVVALGDGNVFIKRGPTGAIKAIKGKLKLEEKKGQIVDIQGKVMVTAAGFYELNKIASVSIITPEKLELPDGSIVVNPYPILDKESGSISKVWVRKISVGYSPTGTLTIVSNTLLYDPKMYLIQELVKKVKKTKGIGRICMKHTLTDDEKQYGSFFNIEGELGISVDLRSPDVLNSIDNYVQNKLFCERKAQTICERNVLKKHPALSTIYVNAEGPMRNKVASVPVVGYTHDLSKEDLEKLSSMDIKKNTSMVKNGEKINIEVVDVKNDELNEEDLNCCSEDEQEMINQNSLPEETSTKPMDFKIFNEDKTVKAEKVEVIETVEHNKKAEIQNNDSERDFLINEINELKDILGESTDTIISDKFGKPIASLNSDELRDAIELINKKIDDEIGNVDF